MDPCPVGFQNVTHGADQQRSAIERLGMIAAVSVRSHMLKEPLAGQPLDELGQGAG